MYVERVYLCVKRERVCVCVSKYIFCKCNVMCVCVWEREKENVECVCVCLNEGEPENPGREGRRQAGQHTQEIWRVSHLSIYLSIRSSVSLSICL